MRDVGGSEDDDNDDSKTNPWIEANVLVEYFVEGNKFFFKSTISWV